MLNPHFGRGLRDLTASRIFYEPLAAPQGDGTFAPVLAEELPTLANGGIAKDGQLGAVAAQEERHLARRGALHRRRRDLQLGVRHRSGTAASTRPGFLEVSRVDKLDAHTVKVVFKKPQPFWAVVFAGGGLIPRHVFESVKGAGAREAVGMIKSVGTGPYRLVEFRTGDVIRAELNPTYHVPNRPYFDRLEIKCGGDSAGAARAVLQTGEYDFAYYVLVEEEVLKRIETGGKGRVLTIPSSGVSHIQLNQTDPVAEVDGERSSLKAPHPCLTNPAVRAAVCLLVDRQNIQEHLVGRTGQIAVELPQLARAVPLAQHHLGVQSREGQRAAGRRRLDTRRGRDPGQGRQAAARSCSRPPPTPPCRSSRRW